MRKGKLSNGIENEFNIYKERKYRRYRERERTRKKFLKMQTNRRNENLKIMQSRLHNPGDLVDHIARSPREQIP